jgi:DNA-binding transcriptional LysR family regulator
VLTEAGKALLPRALRILGELEEYRLQAQRMTMGVEPELTLAVHPYVSPAQLSTVLSEFNREFPSVCVRVIPTSKDVAADALRNHVADLGLVPELVSVGAGLERSICGKLDSVAVAAPNHPLAQFEDATFASSLLRDHKQLVAFSRLDEEEARVVHGYGMDDINVWRVVDFELQRALLLAGIGWGVLPRSRVEDDLIAGGLVLLHPLGWDKALLNIVFVVARATSNPHGPAARWLFDRFARNAVA